MSYTVLGFKAATSTANLTDLAHASWILVFWTTGSLLLTLVYFMSKARIVMRQRKNAQTGFTT